MTPSLWPAKHSTLKKTGVGYPSAFRTFALALANLNRIPEVNELVRAEIAALKHSEENETLATAWLLKPVAWGLGKAKAWDASASCALAAFAIEEKRFGHDLGTLPGTLGGLCASLDYGGRFSEAEPLMQRRVDMLRKIHGDDDSRVSDALSWLAIIYEKDKKFAESEACARDGLAIQMKLSKTNPSCLIRLVRALRRQHRTLRLTAWLKSTWRCCDRFTNAIPPRWPKI